MIELPRSPLTSSKPRVKVLGVGRAGCNMLDRLVLDGVEGVELIGVNTDVQALAACVAPARIHLGQSVTRGLGTGGDPELGLAAAEESREEIAAALRGATVVFLLGGLGGGTASGALPAIACAARQQGAHVIAIATLPFAFEGRRRLTQAEESLARLREAVDLLICFENDRMGEIVSARSGVQDAFAAVDLTLSQCLRGLAGLSRRRGLLHAGFDEVAALFRAGDLRALFGAAEAEGDNRAHEAAAALLKSPLLDRGRRLREIEAAVIHVAGGPDLTLSEVQVLLEELRRHLPEAAQLFFGLAVEPELFGKLTVSVLGALPAEHAMAIAPAARLRSRAPVARVEAPPPEEPAPEEPAELEEAPAAPPPAPVRPRMRPLFAPVENLRREPRAEAGEEAPPAREVKQEQMQFEPVNRGRFEKSEPTIIDGQDLDVPTFLRRHLRLGK